MRWKSQPSKSDIVLGLKIREIRMQKNMTQMQLGRIVNDKCQQIDKYEDGARIPAPKLEELAEALGIRIPKKLIRKIVNSRKLEMEENLDQQEELIAFYNEALEIVEEEES